MSASLPPDWRAWPLERLEREYSPSSRVSALGPLLDAYRTRSEAAHAALRCATLAYGDDPDEAIDVFPAGADAPLIVWVHGGYWQELSRRDSAFGALDAVPRGIAWAAVGYTLAPRASLARIVDQVRRAVRALASGAADLGVDRRRIWLAGSSAGAHLAAMALLDAGAARPAGALLLSGVYDLRPLVPTYVNRALGLDEARAWAASPLSHPMPPTGPVLVAWGEHETASFVAQSRAFATALGPAATTLEVAGRNHFDVVHDLADAATPLGSVVDRMIGPARRDG